MWTVIIVATGSSPFKGYRMHTSLLPFQGGGWEGDGVSKGGSPIPTLASP